MCGFQKHLIRNLQADIDAAAGLDVSEGGAVKVHYESLLSNLVGDKDERGTYPGVRLHIWDPATQGTIKKYTF